MKLFVLIPKAISEGVTINVSKVANAKPNATALASPAAANDIANLAEGLITKPKATNSGAIT